MRRLMLLAACLVPIQLFRGWVWRALEPYGPRRAWLGSSVLFGLWHLGYDPPSSGGPPCWATRRIRRRPYSGNC